MAYEDYDKETLILIINRQNYMLSAISAQIEELSAIQEMSYGEIDKELGK